MTRMLAPEVSTWPSESPQLIGSRCQACAAVTFPRQSRCARCGAPDMEERHLARRGTLVTWTTQEFVPKLPYAGSDSPEKFEPFGVGLVQLGDDVRVEARLTERDPARLQFGMEVELTMVPLYVDTDGTEVLTFAFAPAEET